MKARPSVLASEGNHVASWREQKKVEKAEAGDIFIFDEMTECLNNILKRQKREAPTIDSVTLKKSKGTRDFPVFDETVIKDPKGLLADNWVELPEDDDIDSDDELIRPQRLNLMGQLE